MTPRARLAIAASLAAAVVAAGVWAERVVGPRARPALTTRAARSGAWYCPHGGGDDRRSWVVAANPGTETADLRLTAIGDEASAPVRASLEPGQQRFFPLPETGLASGTEVEFFGSVVAVGMVTARPREGGLAAEPCSSRTGVRWFLPEGSTLEGQTSEVVVLNPAAGEAVVDIALVREDGALEPGQLEGIVLAGGEAIGVELNRFALGERTLGAVVTASLGEVAVAGYGATAQGLRGVIGIPGPAPTWVIPAAGGGSSRVVVLAPRGDAAIDAGTQGVETQKPVLEDATVQGGTIDGFDVEATDKGLVVAVQGEAPVVVARRIAPAAPVEEPSPDERRPPGRDGGGGGGGNRGTGARGALGAPTPASEPVDGASTAGATHPAARWAALPPLTPDGGRAVLLIANPGTEAARVSVELLTPDGARRPQDLMDVAVPPGTMASIDISAIAAEEPVTALVTASQGAVVAAQAGTSEAGFAVSVGVPLPTD